MLALDLSDEKQQLITSAGVSALRLAREFNLPMSLHAVNQLSLGIKRRLYRLLLPPPLATRFQINPISWESLTGQLLVELQAEGGAHITRLIARHEPEAFDPFLFLELADNLHNGIDINFIVMADPNSPRYHVDRSIDGRETLFGTVNRNLAEEEQAMVAGLAPGQVRNGLRASQWVLDGIEWFIAVLGHPGYYLEPMTYVDAWLFERRGCGYIAGRLFMQEIQEEFQPGGKLYRALDGSTPFRQQEQWRTVRGRAWAIHDGILEVLGRSWNGLRMVKRVGVSAGIQTFPDSVY